MDHQLKLRGIRIEPAEIETVLSEHALVVEAAVVTSENTRGELELVGHVVHGRQDGISAGELQQFLRERLPRSMVPARLVSHARLPRLLNGKVDRQALTARPPDNMPDGHPLVVARNELEATLVRIWQELLEVRPIGVTDNFFDLGGHSLLAVGLLARVERDVARSVPLSAFFEGPTIGQLARALDA